MRAHLPILIRIGLGTKEKKKVYAPYSISSTQTFVGGKSRLLVQYVYPSHSIRVQMEAREEGNVYGTKKKKPCIKSRRGRPGPTVSTVDRSQRGACHHAMIAMHACIQSYRPTQLQMRRRCSESECIDCTHWQSRTVLQSFLGSSLTALLPYDTVY
jgi:hypothetical protein